MGNYFSLPNDSNTYRILSYNVEWGFLKIPSDITHDSCGHKIPNTDKAQQQHLKLISKNIGLLQPDICFLQEIGSLKAIQFISDAILSMFNIKYSVYYSNGDETGFQGVGLLVQEQLDSYCTVTTIPNFKLNRALGIDFNLNNTNYKFIGVHLKSLYDGKYSKDVDEQISQINSVLDWVGDCENVIFCGDFNNVPSSSPIKGVIYNKYTNILDTSKYVENISGNKSTEFSDSKSHSSSTIDYMFVNNLNSLVSSHIVSFQRVATNFDKDLRGENSDHLPIMGVFNF